MFPELQVHSVTRKPKICTCEAVGPGVPHGKDHRRCQNAGRRLLRRRPVRRGGLPRSLKPRFRSQAVRAAARQDQEELPRRLEDRAAIGRSVLEAECERRVEATPGIEPG